MLRHIEAGTLNSLKCEVDSDSHLSPTNQKIENIFQVEDQSFEFPTARTLNTQGHSIGRLKELLTFFFFARKSNNLFLQILHINKGLIYKYFFVG